MAVGGSASVSIWELDASGQESDTGVNVPAHDWFLATGQTLNQGTRVNVYYYADDGRFYVVNAGAGG